MRLEERFPGSFFTRLERGMGHLFLPMGWTETRKHIVPVTGSHTVRLRAARQRIKLDCSQQSAESEEIWVLLDTLLSCSKPTLQCA